MPNDQITPMGVGGVQHLIERAYREGSELQYLRELTRNALEAGASRVEFGPEWGAVERHGVYRLIVADNGKGMGPEQLLRFLNTFGGGGKPIGEAHENFGVGAKTSLLPWNHAGVVVISWVPGDPDGSMIWLRRDPKTGEYGAKRFETEDGSFEDVVTPHGEFSTTKPDWISDHGTVVICLGNTGKEDTFLGKDGQGDIKAISAYLNKRLWRLPPDVEAYVKELRSQKRTDWPRSHAEASSSAAHGSDVDRRWNKRRILGAKYFVVSTSAEGRMSSNGVTELKDGTQIEWYLWDGERPAVHSYAHMNGFIAAEYLDELYDTQQHFSQFRTFGITQKQVRTNLTLIAVPPRSGRGGYGVYPDTARSALKIRGTKRAGEALPWPNWGQEFAENMPEEVAKAIAKAGSDNSAGSIADQKWKDRLIDRFGRCWKTMRYILSNMGLHKVHPLPANTGDGPGGGKGGSGTGGSGGASDALTGEGAAMTAVRKARPGPAKAKSSRRRGGVPDWRWTDESEVEGGLAAVWCPNDPRHENGVVLLNREFPPFVELRQYWHNAYPNHVADAVQKTIEEAYGEVMVARIAHSEELKSDPRWGGTKVEGSLRSPEALTMAALGLIAEDSLIAARLRARVGAKARPSAA